MLYQKFYVRGTVGAVLLWTTPVFAQDFTDFWCELAVSSNNKCYVFPQDWSDNPEEVAKMDNLLNETFDKVTPLINYSVQVSTMHGKVSSSPAGISCGSQCSAYFVENSTVQLTATPDPGYQFKGWQGACSGTATTASLTLSKNQNCSAVFELAPITYSVQVSATHGKISSSPTGIDCGSQCSKEFAENSTVQLTATPDSGYKFVNWQGACSGTTATASLTIAQAQSCSTVFELIPVTPPISEPPISEPPTTPPAIDPNQIVSNPSSTVTDAEDSSDQTGSNPNSTATTGSTTPSTPDTSNQTGSSPNSTTTTGSTNASVTENPNQTGSNSEVTTGSTSDPSTPVNTDSDTDTQSTTDTTEVVEKPAISVCAPPQPLQAVENTVELTVGEETVVKVLNGQGRSITKMPEAQLVTVEELEGIGEPELKVKLSAHQAGQTSLILTDCTQQQVTISLIIKPQPPKQCEVHQPLVADQTEVILMYGEGEKTVYFSGGLDDAKIQRQISQLPNPAVVRVAGMNQPLNNDYTVTLAPVNSGETYLKVRDCSGEASVRVIVEKPNALAIDLHGKFIPSKTYFKATLQPSNSVQTYVHVDPIDRGKTLEFIYVLEKRSQGAPTFLAWNSQNWQPWKGVSLADLAIGAVYSDALATFTTKPVQLPDGQFDKLYVGYRVANAIVFYSMKLE